MFKCSICFLSRGPALEQSLPAGLNQVTGVRFPLVFRVHFKWPCTQNITSVYKLKGTIIHCNIRNSKCRKHFISGFTTRQHLHATLGRKLQGTVSPRRNLKWPGNARDHMLELQPFREVWMCSDIPWVSKSVEIEPTQHCQSGIWCLLPCSATKPLFKMLVGNSESFYP